MCYNQQGVSTYTMNPNKPNVTISSSSKTNSSWSSSYSSGSSSSGSGMFNGWFFKNGGGNGSASQSSNSSSSNSQYNKNSDMRTMNVWMPQSMWLFRLNYHQPPWGHQLTDPTGWFVYIWKMRASSLHQLLSFIEEDEPSLPSFWCLIWIICTMILISCNFLIPTT